MPLNTEEIYQSFESAKQPQVPNIPDIDEIYGSMDSVIAGRPKTEFVGGLKAIGRQLLTLPEETLSAAASALQGQSGVDLADPDFLDKVQMWVGKRRDEREMKEAETLGNQQIIPGVKTTDVTSGLSGSLAFSALTAGTGIGTGVATGGVAGTGVALGTAYRMASNQIMRQYLTHMNEAKVKEKGVGLTNEEEEALKAEFSDRATKYGIWEAVPEVAGGLIGLKVLTTPLKKMIGKNVLVKGLAKAAGVVLPEIGEETATQIGQSQTLAGTPLQEGKVLDFNVPGVVEAVKQVAPQTVLISALMGGVGGVAVNKYNAKKASLLKEMVNKEQGHKILDDEKLNNIYKNFADIVESRPNDKELQTAYANILGEIERRKTPEPVKELPKEAPKEMPKVVKEQPKVEVAEEPIAEKPLARDVIARMQNQRLMNMEAAREKYGLQPTTVTAEPIIETTEQPAQKTPSETPPSVASAETQEASGQVFRVAPERTVQGEVKPEAPNVLAEAKEPFRMTKDEILPAYKAAGGRNFTESEKIRKEAESSRIKNLSLLPEYTKVPIGKGEFAIKRNVDGDAIFISEKTGEGIPPSYIAGLDVALEKIHKQMIKKAIAEGSLKTKEAIALHKPDYPDIETWPEMKAEAKGEAEDILFTEARKHKTADEWISSVSQNKRPADTVKENEFIKFTPPESVKKEGGVLATWYGSERLNQYNDGSVIGRVIKINPKSITIKAENPGQWNDGHIYKVPKTANASVDLSPYFNKTKDQLVDIWNKSQEKPATPTTPSPDKAASPNAPTTEIISKEGKGKGEEGAEKVVVEKKYGNNTGRRFAAVLVDGERKDILIRGTKDGKTPNAWGDFFPTEETRTKVIKEKALSESAPKEDTKYSLSTKPQAFYSKLEQAINAKPISKMPVSQLRSMLKGMNVTDAEIENLIGGLEGTVTKQQIIDEIKANSVVLEDVVLGGIRSVEAIRSEQDAFNQELKNKYGDENVIKRMTAEEKNKFESLRQELYTKLHTTEGQTHFSRYQEPGYIPGSYREMFVTAPGMGNKSQWLKIVEHPVLKGTYALQYADGSYIMAANGNVSQWDSKSGAEKYGIPAHDKTVWQDGHSQYSDITNPVVRIRFNDREVDGKKILFIEEMQGPNPANQKKMPEWLQKRIYDLGVKRVLAYAKENGYDGISWTPSEMQTERYSLEKTVEKLNWYTADNGVKHIAIEPKGETPLSVSLHPDGSVTSFRPELNGKPLADIVGKEVSQRIASTPKDTLRGEGLKIGGTGLKKLYDSTIPAMFKKYGKEQVGKIGIVRPGVYPVKTINGDYVIKGVGDVYFTGNTYKPWSSEVEDAIVFDTNEKAIEATKTRKNNLNLRQDIPVPYIPITSKTPGSYPMYSMDKANANLTALTESDVKDVFKWADKVEKNEDGTFSVFKNGQKITVESVDHIAIDDAIFKANIGRQPTNAEKAIGARGSKKGLTIQVSKIGDKWTLAHESYHMLEDAGFVNQIDVIAINQALHKEGIKSPTFEDRAVWVEKNLKDRANKSNVLAKVLQKIQDLIDSFVNLFQRTSKGVLRDIESGKIGQERTSPVFEFAQSAKFSIGEAVKKITDNPKFVRWFGNSKIVDENGKPLVVYHGTIAKEDFNVMEPSSTNLLARGLGIHFAKSPSVSDTFAFGDYTLTSDSSVNTYNPEQSWYKDINGEVKYDGIVALQDYNTRAVDIYDAKKHGTIYEAEKLRGKQLRIARPGGRIIPVYLNIKNPLKVDVGEKDIDDYKVAKEISKIVMPMDKSVFIDGVNKNIGYTTEKAGEIWDSLKAGNEIEGFKSFEHFANEYSGALNGADRIKIIKLLEQAGYDGIIYKNTSTNEVREGADATSYIAFSPTQIKSIFNTEFDPNNPDIRYSLASPEAYWNETKEWTNAMRKAWSSRGMYQKNPGLISKAFNFVFGSPEWSSHPVMQALSDTFIERSAWFNENFKKFVEGDHPESKFETMNEALDSLNEEQMDKFAELDNQFDTSGFTQDEARTYMEKNNIDPAIREVWEAKTARMNTVWDAHMAPIEREINEIDARAMTFRKDPIYPVVSYEIKYVEDSKGNINPQFDKSKPITIKDVLEMMREIKTYAYSPRIRERGAYAVRGFKTAEGREFMRFEKNLVAAEKLKAELIKDGWGKVYITESNTFPESVLAGLKEMDVAKLIQAASDKNDKDAVSEVFTKEISEAVHQIILARGYRRHTIARQDKLVEGYETDPRKKLFTYFTNSAAGLAKSKAARQVMDIMLGGVNEGSPEGHRIAKILGEYHKNPIKANEEARLYDTAKKYISDNLRNIDEADRMIATVKKLATFKYLSWTLRAPLVNTTALLTTVLPSIHQYCSNGEKQTKQSFTKIIKEIGIAGGQYAKIMASQKNKGIKAPELAYDEQAFIDDINRSEYDDPQMIRDMMTSMQASSGRMFDNIVQWGMIPFKATEQWMRGLTMLAGYRIAKANGLSTVQAQQAAIKAAGNAHGIYGKATRQYWAQGTDVAARIGQVATTFLKFPQNYLNLLYDLGWDKGNIKAFTWALAAPVVLGGAVAIPFYSNVVWMINAIMKALGDDRDIEKMVYDDARLYLGKEAEKNIRTGLMGAAGIDVTGSLSMGIGLPTDLLSLTGIFGAMAKETTRAGHFISTKQYSKALETALPSGVANLFRAVRELDGATTSTGARVWNENGTPYIPDVSETTLRILGFRSSERTTTQQRQWESQREEQRFGETRNKIYERYRAYLSKGKPSSKEQKEILNSIYAYNKAVYDSGRAGLVPFIGRGQLTRQARAMVVPSKKEIMRMIPLEEKED